MPRPTPSYEAIKAIWGLLPAAIGDLAFQAANSLVDGVEAMLNGVVSRINGFIGGINAGLEALGSERSIALVPELELGEIKNRFAGAASAATTAAQGAFDRAFEDNPLTVPDLGLTETATQALASADSHRGAARDLADAARAPLESWQALRDAVRGSDGEADQTTVRGTVVPPNGAEALTEATGAAERLENALDGAGRAATGAGAASAAAAAAAEPATEAAATGWQAVTAALSDYATRARDIGADIGQALVGAFRSAEDAVGEFVKTGELNVRDLVTSLIADLAKLGARRFILGPLSSALGGILGRAGGGALANVLHAGGMVGVAAPCAWSRPWPSRELRGCMPAARSGCVTPLGLRASGPTRCRRSCSAASGCSRGRRRAATARAAASPSISTPATPRASGNRGPKWRRTSPGRFRWAGGGSEPWRSMRSGSGRHQSRGARRAGAADADRRARERRRGADASWANSRRRYDVAYGIRRADDLAAVVAFFEARCGRLHGFRFKDWGDYKSCLPSQTPGLTDQLIGTGDGATTAFQLVKRYSSGGQSWARTIAKPVASTVQVAVDGTELASGWEIDRKTGILAFDAAPASGSSVTAGFQFDVPVRFDTDQLDVTLDLERLGSITSIPLIELRR